MNNSFLMRCVQRVGDLSGELQRFIDWKRSSTQPFKRG
jgi:hypothetical protein